MRAIFEHQVDTRKPGRSLRVTQRRCRNRHWHANTRQRWVVVATITAFAVALPARVSTAAVFGPCDPYDAVASGTPVSVASTIAERGIDDAICDMEARVLADIASQRDIPLDNVAAAEIAAHGRNEIRAQLFVKLIQAVNTPPGSRDAVQQGAVNWLRDRVKDVRITQATRALDEFHRWQVERCSYLPPNGFTYTPGPGLCDGSLTVLFSGGPLPPPYVDFAAYGVALTYDELGAGAVGEKMTNLTRDVTNYLGGVAIASGVVLAGVAGAAIVNSTVAIAGLIFASEGAVATGTLGFVAPGIAGFGTAVLGPAAIIVVGIVGSVIRGVQVFEAADIEPELEGDLARAHATDEATLITLLASDGGMPLAMLAFTGKTADDTPAPAALAPSTDPPAETPVLRTVYADFEITQGPTITYRTLTGGANRAWLDRNWWVIDSGADGGPTEIHPVLVTLAPDGSARYVRFDGDEFIVSAFDSNGAFACPGVGCFGTPEFEYLALEAGDTIVASSAFAGLPPRIDSGPAVIGATFEGEITTLEVTAHDPAGGPVSVAWTVESDDGSGGTATWHGRGTTTTYPIPRPGLHTVTAKVTNSLGLATSASTTFFATATLSSQLTLTPENPATECAVLGNVIAQIDPRLLAFANPIVVQLDVDDDGTYEATATTDSNGRAALPIFSSLSRGPHLLRAQTIGFATGDVLEETRELIVVDNAPPGPVELELRYPDGSWGPPPVIDANEPDLGLPHFEEGEEIVARVRVFDPCDEPADIYIGWALAVPSLQRIDVIEQADPGVWYEVSHTFAGDFFPAFVPAVAVAGVDAEGAVTPELGGAYFIVDNVAPTIDTLTVTPAPEHRVELSALVGDAAGIAELMEVTVDWGDGTESDADIDATNAIGSRYATVFASHVYSAAGPRTVTLRVRDDEATTTASDVVDVQGRAPVLSLLELDEGYFSRMVIDVDDPDGDATAASVGIDWGDGTAPTTATYDASAGGFVGAHTYGTPSSYRVVISAADESGVAAPNLIGRINVVPDPIASFQLLLERAILSTWRGSRADNGFLVLKGLLRDPAPDGALFDRILQGGFEVVVQDDDASFDVTLPLGNCKRRGARGILCRQSSPRSVRATILPENPRDPLSSTFVLRVNARRLHDDETGPLVPGVPSIAGPVTVAVRRGTDGTTATSSDCRQRGSATLVCGASD